MNDAGTSAGTGRRVEIAAGRGPRWNELARLVQCGVGGLLRLVALIVLVSVVPARAEDFAGKVVGVSDGDTITVLRGRTPVKIRLHGIDCPGDRSGFRHPGQAGGLGAGLREGRD